MREERSWAFEPRMTSLAFRDMCIAERPLKNTCAYPMCACSVPAPDVEQLKVDEDGNCNEAFCSNTCANAMQALLAWYENSQGAWRRKGTPEAPPPQACLKCATAPTTLSMDETDNTVSVAQNIPKAYKSKDEMLTTYDKSTQRHVVHSWEREVSPLVAATVFARDSDSDSDAEEDADSRGRREQASTSNGGAMAVEGYVPKAAAASSSNSQQQKQQQQQPSPNPTATGAAAAALILAAQNASEHFESLPHGDGRRQAAEAMKEAAERAVAEVRAPGTAAVLMLNVDDVATAHDYDVDGNEDDGGANGRERSTVPSGATLTVQTVEGFAAAAGVMNVAAPAPEPPARETRRAVSDAVIDTVSDDDFDEEDLAEMFEQSARMRAELESQSNSGGTANRAVNAAMSLLPRHAATCVPCGDTTATMGTFLEADASLAQDDSNGNGGSSGQAPSTSGSAPMPRGMFAACWSAISSWTTDHVRSTLNSKSIDDASNPPPPLSPRSAATKRMVADHLHKAGSEVWSHAATRKIGDRAFPAHLCADVLDALVPHLSMRGACPSLPPAGWRMVLLALLHASALTFEPGLAVHLTDDLSVAVGVGAYERDALVELLLSREEVL